MEKPEKLKTEIAVLESILREKRQKLRVLEAIESEKKELYPRFHGVTKLRFEPSIFTIS